MIDDLVECSSHIPKTKATILIILCLGGLSMSNLIKMMPFSGKGSGINLVELVGHYMKLHAGYCYAIRYVHQNEKSIKQQNFLTSMLKDGRYFHSKMKKIKACTQPYSNVSMAESTYIAEL